LADRGGKGGKKLPVGGTALPLSGDGQNGDEFA